MYYLSKQINEMLGTYYIPIINILKESLLSFFKVVFYQLTITNSFSPIEVVPSVGSKTRTNNHLSNNMNSETSDLAVPRHSGTTFRDEGAPYRPVGFTHSLHGV